MSLFFQFLSNPVTDLTKMASIQAATLAFLDENFFMRGAPLPSNFIRSTERNRAKPTDALVHICSRDTERALNQETTGNKDVNGRTSVEVISDPDTGDIVSVEGYSEVWLAGPLEIQGISLSADSTELDFVNVGVLIAVCWPSRNDAHEGGAFQATRAIDGGTFTPTEAVGSPGQDGVSLTELTGSRTAKVTDRNIELIRADQRQSTGQADPKDQIEVGKCAARTATGA